MSAVGVYHRDYTWPALVALHGISVSYRRENVALGTVTLVKGRQGMEMASGGNIDMSVSIAVDEWFGLASDLVAIGVNPPLDHDRIVWVDSLSRTIIDELRVIKNSTRQSVSIDNEGVILQLFTVQVFV